MRVQKSPEEIREGRVNDVIKWQPALAGGELFFRAGTYFFAYWRGANGIVIGTCSKHKVFAKVVSDTEGVSLLKSFRKKYKKLERLQRIKENKETNILNKFQASYEEPASFLDVTYVSSLSLYHWTEY